MNYKNRLVNIDFGIKRSLYRIIKTFETHPHAWFQSSQPLLCISDDYVEGKGFIGDGTAPYEELFFAYFNIRKVNPHLEVYLKPFLGDDIIFPVVPENMALLITRLDEVLKNNEYKRLSLKLIVPTNNLDFVEREIDYPIFNFQKLLDFIYLKIIANRVSERSYGRQWILEKDGHELPATQSARNTNIFHLGIKPDDTLTIKILQRRRRFFRFN